jgi:ketosteroid isomerase-like protein
MTNEQLISEFQTVEDVFNEAIVSNDVKEISKCLSNDWVLIDAQGGIIEKQSFFNAVDKGMLTHQSMHKEILRVKIYHEIALVTGRGQNTATWQGQSLESDEWITDVYRKEGNNWLCVLTHLTPVKKEI